MDMNPLFNPRLAGYSLYESSDVGIVQPGSLMGAEQDGTLVWADEHPLLYYDASLSVNSHDTPLATFPPQNSDGAAVQIDIRHGEIEGFVAPELPAQIDHQQSFVSLVRLALSKLRKYLTDRFIGVNFRGK